MSDEPVTLSRQWILALMTVAFLGGGSSGAGVALFSGPDLELAKRDAVDMAVDQMREEMDRETSGLNKRLERIEDSFNKRLERMETKIDQLISREQ